MRGNPVYRYPKSFNLSYFNFYHGWNVKLLVILYKCKDLNLILQMKLQNQTRSKISWRSLILKLILFQSNSCDCLHIYIANCIFKSISKFKTNVKYKNTRCQLIKGVYLFLHMKRGQLRVSRLTCNECR